MYGTFVQICDTVLKRDAKKLKNKTKQDFNTPIASWSSALHFVAICFSGTKWQNCLQEAQHP